jgi:tRNA nucleotidyltransferase/poly(A) polymerase
MGGKPASDVLGAETDSKINPVTAIKKWKKCLEKMEKLEEASSDVKKAQAELWEAKQDMGKTMQELLDLESELKTEIKIYLREVKLYRQLAEECQKAKRLAPLMSQYVPPDVCRRFEAQEKVFKVLQNNVSRLKKMVRDLKNTLTEREKQVAHHQKKLDNLIKKVGSDPERDLQRVDQECRQLKQRAEALIAADEKLYKSVDAAIADCQFTQKTLDKINKIQDPIIRKNTQDIYNLASEKESLTRENYKEAKNLIREGQAFHNAGSFE